MPNRVAGSGLRAFTLLIGVMLYVFALGAAQGQSKGKSKGKLSGISAEDYKEIFLQADDLPGMKMTQDSRTRGADRGDKMFAQLGGLHSGMAAWEPKEQQKGNFVRIVDIRWVFPSARAAREYLKDQLPQLAERLPPVKSVPKIGDETYAFGGLQNQPITGGKFRSYIVAFRRGNVIVKFFQFEDGADSKLTPLKMAPTCRKILARINSVAK